MKSLAWRMSVGLVCGLVVLVLGVCPEVEAQVVRLDGTSLSVSLPPGWELAPAKLPGLTPTAIHYKAEPGFEVTVRQNGSFSPATAVGLPFECGPPLQTILFSMEEMQKQNGDASSGVQLLPRPDYIPQEYYSRILTVPGSKGGPAAMAGCLYLGNSNISFDVVPAPSPSDGAKLTPILQSIADSGKKISTLLYAPGSLRLPILGVTVSMTSGTWAIGAITLPNLVGQRDLLVRGAGIANLKLMPSVTSGTCPVAMKSIPNQRKNPPYVSSAWEPLAGERLMKNPTEKIELMVCRQIAPVKILLVVMSYGSESVPDGDTLLIARALDDVADAVLKDQNK